MLTTAKTAAAAQRSLLAMDAAGDLQLLAGTIMPDHVHVLFALGHRLRLGQAMAKFKTLAREHGTAAWAWQEDGFEHRLRAKESPEDYGFYIFMNSYRAGLIGLHERWPWWLCPNPSRFLFMAHLRDNAPVPHEWISMSFDTGRRLALHR